MQEEDTEYQHSVVSRLQISNRHVHRTMGPLLLDRPLHPATLLTGHGLLPALRGGSVWAMERGLVFTDPRLGSLVLDFQHCVAAADICRVPARDGGRPGVVVVLSVTEALVPFGILQSGAGHGRRMAVECHGEDARAWAQDVAERWRVSLDAVGVPVTVSEGLPGDVPESLLSCAESAAAVAGDCTRDSQWAELLRRE